MKVKCSYCLKDFNKMPSQCRSDKHFCCKSHAAKYNNLHSPKRHCTKVCKSCTSLVRSNRTYCDTCLQESRISILSNTKGQYNNPGPNRYRSIRDHAKSLMKNEKQVCSHCSYSKHVEVCHIKSISDFPDSATIAEINALTNLTLLCPNHHWELDHSGLSGT